MHSSWFEGSIFQYKYNSKNKSVYTNFLLLSQPFFLSPHPIYTEGLHTVSQSIFPVGFSLGVINRRHYWEMRNKHSPLSVSFSLSLSVSCSFLLLSHSLTFTLTLAFFFLFWHCFWNIPKVGSFPLCSKVWY